MTENHFVRPRGRTAAALDPVLEGSAGQFGRDSGRNLFGAHVAIVGNELATEIFGVHLLEEIRQCRNCQVDRSCFV